jgi:AhpC/TSA family
MKHEPSIDDTRKFWNRAARAIALTTGVLLFGCGGPAAGEHVQDPALHWVGRAAPDIRLKTLDGNDAALADYRGKIVVLHFGASW